MSYFVEICLVLRLNVAFPAKKRTPPAVRMDPKKYCLKSLLFKQVG